MTNERRNYYNRIIDESLIRLQKDSFVETFKTVHNIVFNDLPKSMDDVSKEQRSNFMIDFCGFIIYKEDTPKELRKESAFPLDHKGNSLRINLLIQYQNYINHGMFSWMEIYSVPGFPVDMDCCDYFNCPDCNDEISTKNLIVDSSTIVECPNCNSQIKFKTFK